MCRDYEHEDAQQNEQVIVVVVMGFLHPIRDRPQYCKERKAEPIIEANHHRNATEGHQAKVVVHAMTWQWLNPIEANEVECKFWCYQGTVYPTGDNGTQTFSK